VYRPRAQPALAAFDASYLSPDPSRQLDCVACRTRAKEPLCCRSGPLFNRRRQTGTQPKKAKKNHGSWWSPTYLGREMESRQAMPEWLSLRLLR